MAGAGAATPSISTSSIASSSAEKFTSVTVASSTSRALPSLANLISRVLGAARTVGTTFTCNVLIVGTHSHHSDDVHLKCIPPWRAPPSQQYENTDVIHLSQEPPWFICPSLPTSHWEIETTERGLPRIVGGLPGIFAVRFQTLPLCAVCPAFGAVLNAFGSG